MRIGPLTVVCFTHQIVRPPSATSPFMDLQVYIICYFLFLVGAWLGGKIISALHTKIVLQKLRLCSLDMSQIGPCFPDSSIWCNDVMRCGSLQMFQFKWRWHVTVVPCYGMEGNTGMFNTPRALLCHHAWICFYFYFRVQQLFIWVCAPPLPLFWIFDMGVGKQSERVLSFYSIMSGNFGRRCGSWACKEMWIGPCCVIMLDFMCCSSNLLPKQLFLLFKLAAYLTNQVHPSYGSTILFFLSAEIDPTWLASQLRLKLISKELSRSTTSVPSIFKKNIVVFTTW